MLRKILLLSSILILSNSVLFASSYESRGRASIDYKGGTFSSKPTVEELQRGEDAAVEEAWKKFISTLSTGNQKFYEKNKNNINHKDFVTDIVRIDENIDEKRKKYTVSVRVSINSTLFSNKLSSLSAVSQLDSEERKRVLSLFIGRKVANVTKYDAKRTDIKTYDGSGEVSLNISVDDTAEKTSQSASSVEKNVQGGSSAKKRDQYSYEIESINSFESSFNQILIDNEYEPSSYSDIIECNSPSINDIKETFAQSDEITPELELKLKNAAKECDISYIVIGTVNISMPTREDLTGENVVTATVTGKVFSLRERRSRTIGSVGPEIFSGANAQDDTARDIAIKKAGSKVAKDIVGQLHSKDIK